MQDAAIPRPYGLAVSCARPDEHYASVAELAGALVARAGREAAIVPKRGILAAPGRPAEVLFIHVIGERVCTLGYVYGLGHDAEALSGALRAAKAAATPVAA